MASGATTAVPAGSEEAPAGTAGTSGRAGIGTGLGRYLLNRISGAVVSLLAVLFSAFFIFRVLPGDPIDNLMRDMQAATPELEQALRAEWGLDEPLWVQFWSYLTGTLTGDLGVSIQYQVPVMQLFTDRLGPTVLLGGTALVLSVLIGFSLGAMFAWLRGSQLVKYIVNIAIIFYSVYTD